MRQLAAAALVLVTVTICGPARAEPENYVPRTLEEWRAWVLKGQEFHGCPFLAGSNPTQADAHRCAWPGVG